MILTLKSNHSLLASEKVLGVKGENKSEIITINIEDSTLYNKWAYIEFVLETGVEFLTPRLDIVNGQINYIVPNSLLEGDYLDVQVVFRDATEWVWKSFIRRLIVGHALDVDENIAESYPDFISEAQKILDEAKEATADVENKVDKSTKINGYTLEQDINLVANDLNHISIKNSEIDNLFNE